MNQQQLKPPTAGGLVIQRPAEVPDAVRDACPRAWRHMLGQQVAVVVGAGLRVEGPCVACTEEWLQVRATVARTGEQKRVTIRWSAVTLIETAWRETN